MFSCAPMLINPACAHETLRGEMEDEVRLRGLQRVTHGAGVA